jgi:hypothetical protein
MLSSQRTIEPPVWKWKLPSPSWVAQYEFMRQPHRLVQCHRSTLSQLENSKAKNHWLPFAPSALDCIQSWDVKRKGRSVHCCIDFVYIAGRFGEPSREH